MEEEKTSNKCFKCQKYNAFYTKGIKEFNKTKCGWCSGKREIVNCQDSCEKYEQRCKSYMYSPGAKRCLNSLLTEISEVRKILEAENEENKEMQNVQ